MINLMLFPSCAIKLTTITRAREFINQYNEENREKIFCPMIDEMSTRDWATALEDGKAKLPDILIQAGYRTLFSPGFMQSAAAEGYTDIAGHYDNTNPTFSGFDLKDKNNRCALLGGSFSVIVVNKKLLNGRPLPRSIKDLLKEEYRDMVFLHGHNNNTCDTTVLMDIYYKYGEDGIKKFESSIKLLKHFSWIVKQMTTGGSESPPVAMVPEMFAGLLENHSHLEVIWPEDGSPLFPLFITVKAGEYEKCRKVLDFFTGPVMGQVWSDTFFASTNHLVNNRDYSAKPVSWPGWDFINRQPLGDFLESLETRIVQVVNEKNGIPFIPGKIKNVC